MNAIYLFPYQAPPFQLEGTDAETLDKESATIAARQTIAEMHARRLTARELDTTGDLFDPSAAANPLFSQRRVQP